MTATEFLAPGERASSSRHHLPRALRRLLVVWRRRRRQTRIYLNQQQLDERLLYDLGIDPLNLRASLKDKAVSAILLQTMGEPLDDEGR